MLYSPTARSGQSMCTHGYHHDYHVIYIHILDLYNIKLIQIIYIQMLWYYVAVSPKGRSAKVMLIIINDIGQQIIVWLQSVMVIFAHLSE